LPRLCPRLCPKSDRKDSPLPRLYPTRPPVTCIFCDTIMPIGTDQGSYLQHLEVCSARADLGDELLQPQLQTRRVKVVPGMSNDSLSLKESQLKRKYCDEPGCDREYYNNTDLANHKRRAHGAEKLKCRDLDCPAQFGNSASLSRHMWVKHGIGKGPKCEECGKKESTVQYLRNHQRAAHGAAKLQCKVPGCTKTFIYDTDLCNHMKKKHK